jgi:hypothetical protein
MMIIASSLIGLGNSGGRAFVARMGNTGAPGDNRQICQSCHNGTAIQVGLDIFIKDMNGDTVDSYVPGQTYDVTVKINAERGTPSGYGFQMVALNAPLNENGDAINNWMDNAANLKVVSLNTGRDYVEHDGVSRNGEFTVQWEAPVEGTGDVSFYAAGNGVNLNGGSSGDGASSTKKSIVEAPPVSVFNLLDITNTTIGPNPANEFININRGDRLEENWQFTLYSLNGGVLRNAEMNSGMESLTMDLFGIQPGVYVFQVSNGIQQQAIRFIKQ